MFYYITIGSYPQYARDIISPIYKVIYKARGSSLDIKLQKKWKYDDKLCTGCNLMEESGEEILKCKNLGENEEEVPYGWFYSDLVEEQVSVGKIMMKKLKERKRLREGVT